VVHEHKWDRQNLVYTETIIPTIHEQGLKKDNQYVSLDRKEFVFTCNLSEISRNYNTIYTCNILYTVMVPRYEFKAFVFEWELR